MVLRVYTYFRKDGTCSVTQAAMATAEATDIGFKFIRRKRNSLLLDRDDIVAWRHRYLRAIKKHRESNRNIVFTDETWCNSGHTTSKSWMDTTIASSSQARREGLTTGNKLPSGKGGRVILVHAGAELIFHGKKDDDYHDEMDGKMYEKYFREKLLPNIPSNSVIVLDNASIHSTIKESIPTKSSTKIIIQSWLTSKEFQATDPVSGVQASLLNKFICEAVCLQRGFHSSKRSECIDSSFVHGGFDMNESVASCNGLVPQPSNVLARHWLGTNSNKYLSGELMYCGKITSISATGHSGAIMFHNEGGIQKAGFKKESVIFDGEKIPDEVALGDVLKIKERESLCDALYQLCNNVRLKDIIIIIIIIIIITVSYYPFGKDITEKAWQEMAAEVKIIEPTLNGREYGIASHLYHASSSPIAELASPLICESDKRVSPARKKPCEASLGEEPLVLILAPFNRGLVVEFQAIRVWFSKLPPAERGLVLAPDNFTLQPLQEASVVITWCPTVAGSWREVVTVCSGRRLRLDIALILIAVVPSKKGIKRFSSSRGKNEASSRVSKQDTGPKEKRTKPAQTKFSSNIPNKHQQDFWKSRETLDMFEPINATKLPPSGSLTPIRRQTYDVNSRLNEINLSFRDDDKENQASPFNLIERQSHQIVSPGLNNTFVRSHNSPGTPFCLNDVDRVFSDITLVPKHNIESPRDKYYSQWLNDIPSPSLRRETYSIVQDCEPLLRKFDDVQLSVKRQTVHQGRRVETITSAKLIGTPASKSSGSDKFNDSLEIEKNENTFLSPAADAWQKWRSRVESTNSIFETKSTPGNQSSSVFSPLNNASNFTNKSDLINRFNKIRLRSNSNDSADNKYYEADQLPSSETTWDDDKFTYNIPNKLFRDFCDQAYSPMYNKGGEPQISSETLSPKSFVSQNGSGFGASLQTAQSVMEANLWHRQTRNFLSDIQENSMGEFPLGQETKEAYKVDQVSAKASAVPGIKVEPVLLEFSPPHHDASSLKIHGTSPKEKFTKRQKHSRKSIAKAICRNSPALKIIKSSKEKRTIGITKQVDSTTLKGPVLSCKLPKRHLAIPLPVQTLRLKRLDLEKPTKLFSPTSEVDAVGNPNPFSAATTTNPFTKGALLFHSREWLASQQKELIKWLNALLTPPAELATHDSLPQVNIAELWEKSCRSKDLTLAPSREVVSSLYNTSHRLDALRRAACTLFRSAPVLEVLAKVAGHIENKRLAIRSEIKLSKDVAFCKTIADECQPFLQRFQTSKPMTPYLFEAVEKLLRYLMNRCVKPDLMKCTGPKLLSIDTKKSENLILSKNIDIGFATKRLLGETAITVTERQKLEFIHECRSMLTTMIAKLQEKSPLKQKAVRGLSSLDPCVIQHSPQLAQKRFSFLLEELNHANIINDVLAENAKKEYLHFCNLKKSELQEIFRPCDQFSDEVGLDTIYGSFLIGEANYKHLWEVIKICLVLSHGNATVEGGFSVNKSLLVENMHEKTVIAQRHIHDEIQEAGGIKNIHISKKMLDYVRGARKRYHEYLEMKKQEKSEKDKKKAEKRKLDIQVKDLEGERKKLMMATEEKREAIDVELQELKKKQASLY
uniref:Abnormal spindle-like microcephaly-associated protein ASH domain-containing protein n=1 Tax=Timema cristinae TaxID=61476 RepID=A0A7R9GRS3_TIMCR|nr:unnamed protein product [Timema cristinae]